MSMDVIVKIFGWAMTVVPTVLFIVISGYMVYGASKDDDIIKALMFLGLAVLAIGLSILVLAFFTTFLTFTPTDEVAMLMF